MRVQLTLTSLYLSIPIMYQKEFNSYAYKLVRQSAQIGTAGSSDIASSDPCLLVIMPLGNLFPLSSGYI